MTKARARKPRSFLLCCVRAQATYHDFFVKEKGACTLLASSGNGGKRKTACKACVTCRDWPLLPLWPMIVARVELHIEAWGAVGAVRIFCHKIAAPSVNLCAQAGRIYVPETAVVFSFERGRVVLKDRQRCPPEFCLRKCQLGPCHGPCPLVERTCPVQERRKTHNGFGTRADSS
ncbi:unnamed protein product [Ostreobium quekettii]|uniref:Uncharacterized protein n=1 Tax=Ostreobium quekettii TaxID=121088 RepID=A0A8S1INC2_9CHLO|nr:unnamed protein product [Ostreobium quekettii]